MKHIHICRICKWSEVDGNGPHVKGMPRISKFPFIRYGARHWAHADCGMKKHGMKFLEGLSTGQLERFPVMACVAAGLPGAIAAELNKRAQYVAPAREGWRTPNKSETL